MFSAQTDVALASSCVEADTYLTTLVLLSNLVCWSNEHRTSALNQPFFILDETILINHFFCDAARICS